MDLSPLDRALGAARRGHNAAARKLLDDFLGSDAQNEEALLWRARVSEDPSERHQFLQRTLDVNPNNRWAAQQLSEAPSAPAQPTSSGGVDTLSCPTCGGSVEVHADRGSKAAMCTYCGSVLDLSSSQLDIIGQMDPKVGPGFPIKPGDEGTFFGENHLVMGWLSYEGWDDEDRWRWDEWQLVSDTGVPRYLSHSADEGWTIQTPIRPTPEIGRFGIKLAEGRASVKESGPARITAMQGEFTWRPRLDATLQVMEAQRKDQYYSAELTANEIEVVGGPRVSERDLWTAFGRTEKLAEMDARIGDSKVRRKRLRLNALMATAFAALYFMGIGLASSKGSEIYSGSADFVAAERGNARPDNPDPLLVPVVGERVELGSFEVEDPGSVHELAVAALRPADESTGSFVGRVQIENPDGDLREVLSIAALSADGQPRASSTVQFRPERRGKHTVFAFVDERSPERLAFTFSVHAGQWDPGPFAVACGLAGLIAFLTFLGGGFGRIK